MVTNKYKEERSGCLRQRCKTTHPDQSQQSIPFWWSWQHWRSRADFWKTALRGNASHQKSGELQAACQYYLQECTTLLALNWTSIACNAILTRHGWVNWREINLIQSSHDSRLRWRQYLVTQKERDRGRPYRLESTSNIHGRSQYLKDINHKMITDFWHNQGK